MPYLVFVAGASGSGKTFFAGELEKKIRDNHPNVRISILSMDHYYRRRPEDIVTEEQIKYYCEHYNFDTPFAIDFELFHQQLAELSKGQVIDRPVYSMLTSDREVDTVRTEPADIIIIEGIFAHYQIDQLDIEHKLSIFVESDSYLAYQRRRYIRDAEERGMDSKITRARELSHVRPAFFKYIRPAAQKSADMFLSNNYQPTSSQESDKLQTDFYNNLIDVIARIQAETDYLDWQTKDDEDMRPRFA